MASAQPYVPPRVSAPGFLLAAGLHIALIAAIWNYRPVSAAPSMGSPIMVSLITTQAQIAQPVVIEPLPVKPKLKTPRPQKTILSTAPSPAPAAYETAPPPDPQIASAPAGPPEEPAPITMPYQDSAYLFNKIEYPDDLRRARKQGLVRVRALVTSQGSVSRVELDSSSGVPGLDQAALESVKKWKFVPGRRGDTPVESWALIPVNYSLNRR